MSEAMRLKDKVAVVTGASQGLGQHLSLKLASEGVRVVLAARNQERLGAVRDQIEQNGAAALAVPADVQKEDDCRRLIDLTLSTFGRIDILVLNAGSATFGGLEDLETFAPIRDAMATNFFGAAYPTYLAIEHLIASKGVIAFVTSGSGHLPMAGYLGYSTSKHAMNGSSKPCGWRCIRTGWTSWRSTPATCTATTAPDGRSSLRMAASTRSTCRSNERTTLPGHRPAR